MILNSGIKTFAGRAGKASGKKPCSGVQGSTVIRRSDNRRGQFCQGAGCFPEISRIKAFPAYYFFIL